jgi:hypothetical protein
MTVQAAVTHVAWNNSHIFRRPSLAFPLRVTAMGNLGTVPRTLLRDKDRPTTSIHDKQELNKSSGINTTRRQHHGFVDRVVRARYETAPAKNKRLRPNELFGHVSMTLSNDVVSLTSVLLSQSWSKMTLESSCYVVGAIWNGIVIQQRISPYM